MRHQLTLSVLALVASGATLAQPSQPPDATLSIGNPGFAAPGTREQAPGVPAFHHPNQADQVFVIQATSGNLAEIELARLANQTTGNDAVREFARRMIQDHSQADAGLKQLAGSDAIPLPNELDTEHQQVYRGLAGLTGPEFDIEYLRAQVQDHQRMAQLVEYEIGAGADAQVQRFASDILPKIFMHLAMARDLLQKTSAENPELAAAPPKTISGMPTPQTPRPPTN